MLIYIDEEDLFAHLSFYLLFDGVPQYVLSAVRVKGTRKRAGGEFSDFALRARRRLTAEQRRTGIRRRAQGRSRRDRPGAGV